MIIINIKHVKAIQSYSHSLNHSVSHSFGWFNTQTQASCCWLLQPLNLVTLAWIWLSNNNNNKHNDTVSPPLQFHALKKFMLAGACTKIAKNEHLKGAIETN